MIDGELTGRSLRVTQWRFEPHSTSAWVPLDVRGTDTATTDAVVTVYPRAGQSLVSASPSLPAGSKIVVLEVDRATPEIHDWVRKQPSGSVHLITFIIPTPNI